MGSRRGFWRREPIGLAEALDQLFAALVAPPQCSSEDLVLAEG